MLKYEIKLNVKHLSLKYIYIYLVYISLSIGHKQLPVLSA